MDSILQGTTASVYIPFETDDIDIGDVTELELVFRQGDKVLKKSLDECDTDPDSNTLIYDLTEQETLMFDPGYVTYQVRMKTSDGVFGTEKYSFMVEHSVSRQVMG